MKKFLISFSLVLLAAPALAGGDAQKGGTVFEDNCSDCHTVVQGAPSRKGPNLFGVVGRKTAALADFDYSDANRAAGWTWTPEKLDQYLTNPKATIPGTIMKFKGTLSADERANVIAFLQTLSK